MEALALEILGIHHVSLAVTDLERSRQFYGGILGLEVIDRPAFDFAGAWYRLGSHQLHLIVHPQAGASRGANNVDTRDAHFAVRVKDLTAAVAWLKARDVSVLERPDSRAGWPQAFVADPDGNIIELAAI